MTKAKLRKLLTKPKFRAWLEAKKPGAVVGVSWDSNTCPLAQYLNNHDTYNVARAYVTTTGTIIDTPVWCKRFIHSVDLLYPALRISASRALRILDTIK